MKRQMARRGHVKRGQLGKASVLTEEAAQQLVFDQSIQGKQRWMEMDGCDTESVGGLHFVSGCMQTLERGLTGSVSIELIFIL